MLILTRNQNESIVIDDDIRITVLSDKHGQVKLGIKRLRMSRYGARRFMKSSKVIKLLFFVC